MNVTYLSRADWGAGPHRSGYAQDPVVKVGLAIHHTVMAFGSPGNISDIKSYMRQLQTARPDLGGEVPYSFVIFPGATKSDGIVAEGRGAAWSGAHTVDYNTSRLGCSFAGNASTDPVTPGVIEAFVWVGANKLVSPRTANRTFGHRDVKSTECPGNGLYARLDQIQPPFTIKEGITVEQADRIISVVQAQGRKSRKQAAAIANRADDKAQKRTVKTIDEITAAIEAEA